MSAENAPGWSSTATWASIALYRPDGRVGAAEAAEHLKSTAGILVVDEADAIVDPKVLDKVGVLVKHLSDLGSPFKVLIVGTDATAAALMNAHPSVQHCLESFNLSLLTVTDLCHLVRTRAEALGLAFADEVIHGIAQASAGQPYFAHLLALKCAEKAVVEGRPEVRSPDLPYAMAVAMSEVEPNLSAAFLDAIDGDLESPTVELLKRAAAVDDPEFESDAPNRAFEPVRPGVYKFANPRMRPYIRLRYPFG